MEAADQRRQHVAVGGGGVAITRGVEVGGHQVERVKAVLAPPHLAPFDTGIIGDRANSLMDSSAPVRSASSRIVCSAHFG